MSKAKKKFSWKSALVFAAAVLFGGLLGFLCMLLLDRSGLMEEGSLYPLLMVVFLYAGILVQIIVHEGGHLVFGLISGYRFSSFRIGSLMLLKENGQLRLRRLSIAGTGGQCLMIPPEGELPYVLYNLGGSLMNLIFSALCALLCLLPIPWLVLLGAESACIGVFFALLNGIPMRMGGIDNDGYNALSLGKNPEALAAFRLQLAANGLLAQGMRVKDMPEEWFTLPEGEALKNSMAVTRAVLCCNRLMDLHAFEQAKETMAALLAADTAMAGLHKSMMVCDLVYCLLILGQEGWQTRLTAEQEKFMRSMKTYPTVLRTQYAIAALGRQDEAAAQKALAAFEKCARSYPYAADIESERELIALAEEKAAEKNN